MSSTEEECSSSSSEHGRNLDNIFSVDKIVHRATNIAGHGQASSIGPSVVTDYSRGHRSGDDSSTVESSPTLFLQLYQFLSMLIVIVLSVVTAPYRFVAGVIRTNQNEIEECNSKNGQDTCGTLKSLSCSPPSTVECSDMSIQDRVERLESKVTKLLKPADSGSSNFASTDRAAERIKYLEDELAETKKVLLSVLSQQEELCEVLERLKELKWGQKLNCW